MSEPWTERREHWSSGNGDARSQYDIDYARIIHSASFRRLQGKTQILNLGDSDFYRTRLTHSLEVSQVSYGLTQQLKKYRELEPLLPSQSLIQAIGLIHDLGHPPFGHGGELALNYCMRDNGGFEGNGQTLRILGRLEKFSKSNGSNLTRRTLLGCLKYPIPYGDAFNGACTPTINNDTKGFSLLDRSACKPPKCYLDTEQEIVDWVLEPLLECDKNNFIQIKNNVEGHHSAIHKSLDCSIMDIADDISNGVHDLEDAISMGLVTRVDFINKVLVEDCSAYLEYLCEKYPDEFSGNNSYDSLVSKLFDTDGSIRKRQIGRLVHYFISSIEYVERNKLFTEPLLRFNAQLPEQKAKFVKKLKDFVFETVIRSPNVQHLEFKGQQMVLGVFDIFAHEPKRFLEDATYQVYLKAESISKEDGLRVLCDHIAGMTDSYLLRLYERLLSPRLGSVFDKL